MTYEAWRDAVNQVLRECGESESTDRDRVYYQAGVTPLKAAELILEARDRELALAAKPARMITCAGCGEEYPHDYLRQGCCATCWSRNPRPAWLKGD